MAKGFFPAFCLVLILGPLAGAEDAGLPFRGSLAGDGRAAEQYLLWAEAALAAGRGAEALAALERGADFSDVSSDISYLLARVRFDGGKPAGAVLEALRRALEADRWNRYTPEAARLLEAEVLIRLRFYGEALEILSALPRSAAELRLRILASRFIPGQFVRLLEEALDRYPREAWPLRILFEDAAGRNPRGAEGDLMAVALRRLPLLVEADPDLAWLAFPFIVDLEEAGRLAAAYRAAGWRNPAALPAALNLGLVGEEEAVGEFFRFPAGDAERRFDKALVLRFGNLLLTGAGRESFKRNFLGFSGVIVEDIDGDGYPEAEVYYRDGFIVEYRYDRHQDGLPELTVFFDSGVPLWAEPVLSPETFTEILAYPVRDGDRVKALIHWEQYPAVLEASLEWVRYIPRPGDFFYAPFQFQELGGTGLLFPGGDPWRMGLSRRTLLYFATVLERPSGEFAGGVERIELNRGVPERAREFVDGRLAAETEFFHGWPVLQRIDLDLDGRLETVRRFRRPEGAPLFSARLPDYREYFASSESDWDGDGIFETVETYGVIEPAPYPE